MKKLILIISVIFLGIGMISCKKNKDEDPKPVDITTKQVDTIYNYYDVMNNNQTVDVVYIGINRKYLNNFGGNDINCTIVLENIPNPQSSPDYTTYKDIKIYFKNFTSNNGVYDYLYTDSNNQFQVHIIDYGSNIDIKVNNTYLYLRDKTAI